MLEICRYFDILNIYMNDLTDNVAIYQALADPKKSHELTEFVQSVVHDETSSLMREHNDVIQMQRDEIASLRSEIDRLQRARMDNINAHAAEVQGLQRERINDISTHAAEVQGLHVEYTIKLKNALVGMHDDKDALDHVI